MAGLLGCAAPRPDSPPLRLAVRADVAGFFPEAGVNEAFTVQVNDSIFDTLVRFDRRLLLQPALAVRWDNPDDRTYRFELRPGLRFSDGRPLTAHEVAAALEANRRGWVTRDYLQAVESVRAVDDLHLEIRTRVPYLALLTRLPWGFVVAPATAAGTASPGAIGSGPYRLTAWERGREIRLSANPHWRGDPPAFAEAVYQVVPDAGERVRRVERGEADVADQVPLDDIARLERRPGLRVIRRAGLRVLFLSLRVDRPPFSDPRLREALDRLIDRHELSRRALFGLAEPASQLVTPAIVGYDPAAPVPPPDRQEALRLLRSAGATRLAFRLDGPNNRYVNDREILAELARQLREAGLDVDVNAIDKRAFFPLIESGQSVAHLMGYSCESGDAGDVLGSVMHSARGGPLGSLNSSGLRDPELDRLIAEADAARGDDARASALRTALRYAASLRVALPLVIQTEAVLLGPRVDWDPPLNLALRPEEMKRRK